MQKIVPLIYIFAAILPACFMSGCSRTPGDHARIATGGGSYEERAASVQALAASNNQALLASVAAYARDPRIRVDAAEKLTDPRLLADFARNDPFLGRYSPVLPIVAKKIGDPRLLATLVHDAGNAYMRIEAGQSAHAGGSPEEDAYPHRHF